MQMPDSAGETPQRIAAEIKASMHAGRLPSLTGRDIPSWRMAVHVLLQGNEVDAARHGARALLATGRELQAAQTLWRMIEVMPPVGPEGPFQDDPEKEVQIVPRAGAKTAILVFSGVNHFVGVPFATAQRWFGQVEASVIYLRDTNNLSFLSGIRSLGVSQQETVAQLRQMLATLGASRVVCYGNSIGGFAALSYGIDLAADAVVSMAGPTDLDTLRSPWATALRRASPVSNLRGALVAAARPPEVLMVCSDGNWDDRLQVQNIAGLGCVTFRIVEGYDGHAVFMELICRQQFDRVLTWMASAAPETPCQIAQFTREPWRAAFG
jgi:hypothetical protein